MIIHKYAPFNPNIHEKYKVYGHMFLYYQALVRVLGRTWPSRATQRLKCLSPFILVDFTSFSLCGTMFPLFLKLQDTWHRVAHRIESRQSRHVNLVDLGPLDHHQRTCTKRIC